MLSAPQAALDVVRPRIVIAVNAGARRYGRLMRSDAPIVAVGLTAATLLGSMAARQQWQQALTLVLLATAAAVYVRWATAGIGLMLAVWLLAPFLRRVIDWVAQTFGGVDLLSLTPFLVTALVAVAAARRQLPSRRLVLVLALYWSALAVGVPLGLTSPSSLAFGVFAFVTTSLAALIGYVDGMRGNLALPRILAWAVLPLSLYGIAQYVMPLTPWDALWVRTAGFVSLGNKENGTLRPFATLNAPGTLATVLAVFLITLLATRRIRMQWALLAVPAVACIAITSVRTAWLSLALAALLLIPLSRGQAILRIVGVVAAVAVLYVAFGGTAAGRHVAARATTLTTAGQDVSLADRLRTVVELGPQAVAAPLGHGIGSVGQSARAGTTGFSQLVDNGYLILLWQVGPAGFLLAMVSIGLAIAYGVRGPPQDRQVRLRVLAPILLLLVVMVSGEILYGVTAMLLWYHLGALMGGADRRRSAAV